MLVAVVAERHSVWSFLLSFVTVHELIGRTQEDETLDDYFCEVCNGKTLAIKSLEYTSLPPIVVFQINRFTMDSKFVLS